MVENTEPKVVIVPDTLGMQIRGNLKIRIGGVIIDVVEMISHPTPDLDAMAWYLIGTYCGVSMPKPVFEAMDKSGLIRGKTPEALLFEGVITVDTGKGQFDHHPADQFPNECATSRFYKIIPLEMKNEILDKFVRFVIDRDTRRTQYPLDLSHIAKVLATNNKPRDVLSYMNMAFEAYMSLYIYDEKDKVKEELNKRKTLLLSIFKEFSENNKKKIPEIIQKYMRQVEDDKTSNIPDLLRITTPDTRDIVILILEELYQNQCEFDEAAEIIKTVPRIPIGADQRMTVKGGNDKEFGDRFLTYVVTDNKHFVKAALHEGFSVVIIKNSKGQVQIFSQINHFVPMEDIARAVIAEEIRLSGPDGEKRWYYHKAAIALLNGSFTTPNQIPTAIPIEGIAEAIVDICAIHNGYLPFCKGGKLNCSPRCHCYSLMVSKCQQIREKQKETNGRGEMVIMCSDPKLRSDLKRKTEQRNNLKK